VRDAGDNHRAVHAGVRAVVRCAPGFMLVLRVEGRSERACGCDQDGECAARENRHAASYEQFLAQRLDGAADAVVAELTEDVSRAESLLDELVLVGIEQVRHEPRVLVHDVRPEAHDFLPIELGLPASEIVETAFPAFRLVAL
jgi:hypothetical protein